MEAHPRHAEHFPCANRVRCPLPSIFAFAKLDTIVGYVVPGGDFGGRRSDLREARAWEPLAWIARRTICRQPFSASDAHQEAHQQPQFIESPSVEGTQTRPRLER